MAIAQSGLRLYSRSYISWSGGVSIYTTAAVERDAVLFHFDALEKKYKKFCHVKQRKKKKKKFSFFFFLRNQQKIPLRHELFYHTDREKRTYHGGGGGERFFFTRRTTTNGTAKLDERRDLFIRRCSNKNAKEPSEERKEKYIRKVVRSVTPTYSYTVTSSTSFPSFLLFL